MATSGSGRSRNTLTRASDGTLSSLTRPASSRIRKWRLITGAEVPVARASSPGPVWLLAEQLDHAAPGRIGQHGEDRVHRLLC